VNVIPRQFSLSRRLGERSGDCDGVSDIELRDYDTGEKYSIACDVEERFALWFCQLPAIASLIRDLAAGNSGDARGVAIRILGGVGEASIDAGVPEIHEALEAHRSIKETKSFDRLCVMGNDEIVCQTEDTELRIDDIVYVDGRKGVVVLTSWDADGFIRVKLLD